MMKFSPREIRRRAGLKRGSAAINPPTVEPKPGGLTAEKLIRWRNPEKPIETID
jgi:hypothetical protein